MTLKQRWQELMANQPLKRKLYGIIFGSDTRLGRMFDIVLMICIIVSILITIFDSLFTNPWIVGSLVVLEYLLTAFFTFEYLARLYCSPNPRDYVFSFFGIVDLVSILPMYLGWLLPGARFMIALRSIRLIRVFRVFKLFSFLEEGYLLMESIRQSFKKIFVFFLFVVIMVICLGTIMYAVESGQPGTQFTSIPTSIYWAIVTMTTVGYGDIIPVTAVGRFFASIVMLLGYTIVAVPTGIVSASMVSVQTRKKIRKEKLDKDELNGEK
ncbi:MAG: ion transporter [Bacteroidales bacterium]|jgi:voltage-gated potassium channel|nr:ion transporter [Bacteroidales bacterium]MBP5214913.1 ion transporter [Bacteroidales bacterium]MBP5763597.1 ion transporter [Bacteroidales bacterium]